MDKKSFAWERMEKSLRELIAAISASVPPLELKEAVEKVDHREYGIAVQLIGALILENRVRLEPEAKQKMIVLMEEMGMMNPADEDYWFGEKIRPALQ